MNERPLSRILARLEALGCRPRGHNGTWRAHCPAHDDRRPSLALKETEGGQVLLLCRAGCKTEDVLERLELAWADLFPDGHQRHNGHDRRQAVDDPLSWWAERCGVPRGWLKKLPLEARDGGVAFLWPGLETVKRRARGSKGWWEPEDGPRPPLWPALPEAAPLVMVLCEGESDTTVAAYIIEALKLEHLASAHGVTKGASQRPDPPLLQELVAKGFRGLLLIPDADAAGREWGAAWAEAARRAGLLPQCLDLVALGLVSPSLGEADLRDTYRRRSVRVMGALKAVIEGLAAQAKAQEGEILSAHNKGGSWAERIFLPASQLLAQPQATTNWVLPGYLLRGGVTLLSSRPKLGKTTLTAHVVGALLQGSEVIGRQASRVDKVAYLSEEPPSLFADRLRTLGLDSDRLLVAFRHQARQPLSELLREALGMGAEVAVVDTVAAWAGIEDENSATEVEKALRPVISLAQERGVSILLLHHLNKADGPEGTAHRGSGHLVAMVDIAVELRRPEGNAPATRRVLKSLSRYQETPQELVIELQEGGYEALGTGEQVIMRQAEEALLDVLPGPAEEAIPFESARPDADTIMGRLGGSKLPRTTLQRALASLVERGRVARQGSGKRGDPYRYRLAGENSFPPNSQVYMGGNKTDETPNSEGGNPERAWVGPAPPADPLAQALAVFEPEGDAPPTQDPPPLPSDVQHICPRCGGEAELLRTRAQCLSCLLIFTPPRIPDWALRVFQEEAAQGEFPNTGGLSEQEFPNTEFPNTEFPNTEFPNTAGVSEHDFPNRGRVSEHPGGVSEHLPGVSEHYEGVSEQGPEVSEHLDGLSEQPRRVSEHGLSEHPRGLSEHHEGLSEHRVFEQAPGVSEHYEGVSEHRVSEQARGVSEQAGGVSEQPARLSEHLEGVSERHKGVSEHRCPGCGRGVPLSSTGRPRRWCSDACRMRFRRSQGPPVRGAGRWAR